MAPGFTPGTAPAMTDRQGLTDNDPRDDRSGTVTGTVIEALPSGLYRVVIDRQRQVTAHAPGGAERTFVRVLVGDRVKLKLSPRDDGRGRIVGKM
jgi:translation initiation factor IF-1